ncbi:MAG: hypothetical protein Q9226_007501, partial [Calogaya cf. arnoldii]
SISVLPTVVSAFVRGIAFLTVTVSIDKSSGPPKAQKGLLAQQDQPVSKPGPQERKARAA